MVKTSGRARKGPYHHGNLRNEILDAALEEIDERGPVALSLRELARRAGVSHAAPAHHFGDKAGLLTAIAVQGFELLGDALRSADESGEFLDVGLAYIGFAVDHPAHFEVMFRLELYLPDAPDVVAARAQTNALLYGPAAQAYPDADPLAVGIAAWAFVHGFASIWLTGNLQHRLGDDPIAAARAVAPVLFTPPTT
jgi:AcrR family transcriptional regulator